MALGTTGDKKVHAIIYGNFLLTLQTCPIFYEYEHFLIVMVIQLCNLLRNLESSNIEDDINSNDQRVFLILKDKKSFFMIFCGFFDTLVSRIKKNPDFFSLWVNTLNLTLKLLKFAQIT